MFSLNQPNFVGLVSRPKLAGGGRHAGVLLPSGQVAHMTPEGSAVVSFEQFAQGLLVTCDQPAPVERYQQIQWRAFQSIGRMPTYNLLKLNCEHYATWLMGEEPQSQQVKGLTLVALLGAFFWLAQQRAR